MVCVDVGFFRFMYSPYLIENCEPLQLFGKDWQSTPILDH
ncbi:unnamed protein product [marine sediment metagenome]|uniref:Uncharacterized protein n=1 Tax=marine sediment metagenome TaxID=412755 RepID=X1CCN3_9ZZZZ